MESQIHKIHQQLVNKEISCMSLVQEKLNLLKQNTHNSVNSLLEDSALASAKKVDTKIENGQEIGLLEGIPFGIKDVYMLQGTYTTASSDLLKKYKMSRDITRVLIFTLIIFLLWPHAYPGQYTVQYKLLNILS